MQKNSHNYDHSHEHKDGENLGNIKLTLILNFVFATVELFFGLFANSITLFSNSIHDYGDSIILLTTLIIEKHSYKGRNNKYTYGYRRYSLVGAIINNIILLLAGIFITIEAIKRIMNPEAISSGIVFLVAIFGIAVNIIGYMKLKNNDSEVNKSLKNNLFADILSWTALLISSLIMYYTGFYILDGLMSLFIALNMFYAALKQSKSIFNILMQTVPDTIDLVQIENYILSKRSIIDVHDVHLWTLDGEDFIMSMHLVVNDGVTIEQVMDIKEEIKQSLEEFNINHTTIEVDNLRQAIINGELQREAKQGSSTPNREQENK